MSAHPQFEHESDTYAIYGAADQPRRQIAEEQRDLAIDWLTVASEAAGALLCVFVPLLIVGTLYCLLKVTR